MRRMILFIALISTSLFSAVEDFPELISHLEEVAIFEGDSHEEFQGDLLVKLSDGSSWKMHADYIDTYSAWEIGEPVYVSLRTSFYWFKREHKFNLVNLARNEEVPVMIIDYPENALTIIEVNTYEKTMLGSSASIQVGDNHFSLSQEMKSSRSDILLSDGSRFEVSNNKILSLGKKVYKAFTDDRFVLITGTEREATYCFAEMTRFPEERHSR